MLQSSAADATSASEAYAEARGNVAKFESEVSAMVSFLSSAIDTVESAYKLITSPRADDSALEGSPLDNIEPVIDDGSSSSVVGALLREVESLRRVNASRNVIQDFGDEALRLLRSSIDAFTSAHSPVSSLTVEARSSIPQCSLLLKWSFSPLENNLNSCIYERPAS